MLEIFVDSRHCTIVLSETGSQLMRVHIAIADKNQQIPGLHLLPLGFPGCKCIVLQEGEKCSTGSAHFLSVRLRIFSLPRNSRSSWRKNFYFWREREWVLKVWFRFDIDTEGPFP